MPPEPQSMILFGDLHAHSSNSLDALVNDLPLVGGKGDRDPDLRCRFARYCAGLDFWALVDHAEEQTAGQWAENLEAIRACNDRFGGYDHEPEMVSFAGWEWTPNADTPDEEWGHRNVVLKDTCPAAIPVRSIASSAGFVGIDADMFRTYGDILAALDPDNAALYAWVVERVIARFDKPDCDPDTDTLALPADCHETAGTLEDLFHRLDRWDVDALVIPHGMGWGSNAVPQGGWRHQFTPAQHDPRFDFLMEIYSGHGNSEEYRTWKPVNTTGDGALTCPDPVPGYESCCWRAGAITRDRSPACQTDPAGDDCRDDVESAKQAFLDGGRKRYDTLTGTDAQDWLDCGQCRDCFQPARDYRPDFSVQAALARTDFAGPGGPWRYRFGMIGSTDSHRAGPGAGYKEIKRLTDGSGPASADYEILVDQLGRLVVDDFERQNSFYHPGGLVAAHAEGRDREALWDAIRQRRVYATSGDRIELWFDLLNGPGDERLSMGSEVMVPDDIVPSFEVRAKGAPRQAAGCPDKVLVATSKSFVTDVCFGECWNPTGERHAITRIEVVKVTPRIEADEALETLIQDPFRVLPCNPDPDGCTVTFDDPDFVTGKRPATYYVRAIQEPTLQVNAGGLRCDSDDGEGCDAVNPCRFGYDGANDDCVGEDEERAWSSPIYVNPDTV